MERVRTIALLVLLTGLAASGPAAAQNERIIMPMEDFLPRGTLLFVKLPNANVLSDLLTRTGDDRAALAKRLVAGSAIEPESVATLLEIVQAAADGPVTLSLHTVGLPARPGIPASRTRHFLVTLATRRNGDGLQEVGRELVRGLLAPVFAKKAKEELLTGFPCLHLSGKGPDLYVVYARGRIFISSSALILGRVLREVTGPTGRTLAYVDEFVAARADAATKAKRKPHGFLWVRDASFFPMPEFFDGRRAGGVLVKTEDGYRDEVTVATGEKSIFRQLTAGGKAPGAWVKSNADGVWMGANLSPRAIQRVAAASMQFWQAQAADGIGDIAAGPMEILLRTGEAPLLRFSLRPEVSLEEVAKKYRNNARVEGRVMIFGEDPKAVAAAEVGEESTFGSPMVINAKLSRLLSLLGAPGMPDGSRTILTVTPAAGNEGAVVVSAGRAETGLFAIIVKALTR